MELRTISQVSKGFGLSTRTLRYYEQIGLIESTRQPGYAYRVYDKNAIMRLQQIVVLRKLRIPLKQIKSILDGNEVAETMQMLRENVRGLDDEIMALSVIRSILQRLVDRLQLDNSIRVGENVLDDDNLVDLLDTLSLSKIDFREERDMDELNKANEQLMQIEGVRILQLPKCTVAAAHYIGENPEEKTRIMLEAFIKEASLYQHKPDARVFGFNHPSPTMENPEYGYEVWVSIPDGMDVPVPMEKKEFPGGLYAAYTITLGNFQDWDKLLKWVKESENYTSNQLDDGGEYMGGCMEGDLNAVYYMAHGIEDTEHQMDLLLPIKEK